LIFKGKKPIKGVLLEDAGSFKKDEEVVVLTRTDYFAYYLIEKNKKKFLVEKECIKIIEEINF